MIESRSELHGLVSTISGVANRISDIPIGLVMFCRILTCNEFSNEQSKTDE